MNKEKIMKEIEEREKAARRILDLVREEARELNLRENEFELHRHKFCEAEMSQDLEYDILKLREEADELRTLRREVVFAIEKRHGEFIDAVIDVISEEAV